VEKRTLLVKRATLPYEFETDENCALTESLKNATLYEPSTQRLVTIEYTHMQANKIMSKDKITLSNEISIKLTDEFTLNLSTY
jgi:DNA recombination-dependent growth factor C